MLDKIKIPQNLSMAQIIREHRLNLSKHGFDYHAFVLGQSPFPVPLSIQQALKESSSFGMYGSSTGLQNLKSKIVEFNHFFYDLQINPNQIFISNGTKMLIYMLVNILEGTFILPTPAWVGYEPIFKLLNKKYIKLRLKSSNDYKIDLKELEATMHSTDNPILILNNPHNPTGVVLSNQDLNRITEICKANSAYVVADEIYGLITYKGEFNSFYKYYPEKTFVTQGISKDRSAAGYRLGVGILPLENQSYFLHQLNALASIMYTNVSTPIQNAAVQAYTPDYEIQDYIKTVREIHKMVGEFFSSYAINECGLNASTPESAFYIVIDFNNIKSHLQKSDITTTLQLSKALFSKPYYVAVVTGEAISVDDNDFLARLALVDYDGSKVQKNYVTQRPQTKQEIEKFIKNHMKHMIDGFNQIKRFVEDIKKASV